MSLTERDKKHLWHPLTQHKTHPETLAIKKASNCLLEDYNNNFYIDAIASWYTCMYGHCNPKIVSAVKKQMETLDQVIFSGFTHAPAIELSEALIAILPENQNKLFFSDNGSTTIEIAIKMALQYHFNLGHKKDTLIAFENGFHGDTFGAMSVSGLSVYNGPFEDFSLKVIRIPVPNKTNIDSILKELSNLNSIHNIAAFVYEPLVQGAAGMKMHCENGLNAIIKYCNSNQIISIADEVMTGFGKTGKNFASDYMENKPEIICLSKALTAGLLPMGITSCSEKIYSAFFSNDLSKGFFHGHTYSANPLACKAALTGIELLTSKEIQNQIKFISKSHLKFTEALKTKAIVKEVRCKGVILALDLNLEINRYGNLRDELYNKFLKLGVYLRPLGATIYILPPYTMSNNELKKVYQAIENVIDQY
jgi:adenosylmethionine-8-amino-7-oxononanoate aminotransferase